MDTEIMNTLKKEENRLDQEQEDSHGDLDKMQLVFEKKINLYKRCLKKEGLSEMDKLRLENKNEWILSHQLALIERKEYAKLHVRIVELTRRLYRIEKQLGLE